MAGIAENLFAGSERNRAEAIDRKGRRWGGEVVSILLINLLAIFFPKPLNPSGRI
jgi:hypothetical protein